MTVRYQVALGYDDTDRQFEFKAETSLKKANSRSGYRVSARIVPDAAGAARVAVGQMIKQRDNKVLVNKASGGNDNCYNESSPANRSWAPSFKLGTQRSALGNLPADQSSFPTATWFREYLGAGIQRFTLNSAAIRQPSPPTRAAGFLPDGSNVSWVAGRLRQDDPARHAAWIAHLRTALPDLEDIEAVERPEDRHCYMVYRYAGGLAVPSWLVSDGTLRLTGLTLPAYLPDLEGVFLVEEPENGIHPKAVATVFDSLSSVYGAQVLMATHSPVVLNAANSEDVLCFARDDAGATDIVSGTEHPHLQAWRGDADLGTLLAAGVLG